MNRLVALLSASALALAPLATGTQPAMAQTRISAALGGETQLVNLPRGSSAAIDLPVDARDVIVSNPAVAEAMLHSSRRITVIGIAPGETDAIFLDAAGRTILSLRVRVDTGVGALQDTLSRVVPGSDIRAEAVNESVILTGSVNSPGEADRAVQVARQFVSAPERVLNMLTIAGSDQVMLKVRVVEVQRSSVKQLGFDTSAVLGQVGDIRFLMGQTATFGVNGGLQGGMSAGYSNAGADQSSATLHAFEQVGLARTLAEPNLTSVNGEAASFLAGGEFPVVVGRDNTGTILTEFKPYGVSLSFRPIVMSSGRISMQISVEVSELTNDGALTLGAGTASALTLPGLNIRRSSNTVEMPSGGSMMIAGLLQESTRQNIDGLPGATNLPILGQLFRSRDYLMGETELVIIVEPYIVTPTSPGRMQTPADGLRIASDAQTILFGQLNQAYGTPATPGATAGGWQGPVGYVIE